MTEMFGEAWSPMSVPDLAPDDDDDDYPDNTFIKLLGNQMQSTDKPRMCVFIIALAPVVVLAQNPPNC